MKYSVSQRVLQNIYKNILRIFIICDLLKIVNILQICVDVLKCALQLFNELNQD